MSLIAKPSIQEVRGTQRIVHCRVYDQTVDAAGVVTNDHRSDLDFDVIVDVNATADDVKRYMAERLVALTPPATPPADLALAELASTDAPAVLAASVQQPAPAPTKPTA